MKLGKRLRLLTLLITTGRVRSCQTLITEFSILEVNVI